ncbi:MAG: endoglucanase [Alphaproteobacteria bacterium]|nr:endoglucanase [Alphaproteobacteria bacterium]MBV9860833.1 endoglucanase [Alphaproteobacteria bacterium]
MPRFCLQLAALAYALLAAVPGFAAASGAEGGQWPAYRDRFVTSDGRVLDDANQQITHTEGQGWAMLLAEAAGDRASFDRIWAWTRDKLQRKDIALFAWKWDGKDQVADRNDASDGDILIAWALSRAARQWNEPRYANEARRIAADIRRRLFASASGRLVLLPGSAGFKSKGDTIVNPSYYIFPALKELAALAPAPEWQRLQRDGLGLLADARFGRWGLTPDWVAIDQGGAITPAPNFPPHFGFDAVRIPLYLIWAGEGTEERLASYLDFWNIFGDKPVPAWADIKDNSVAPFAGSAGVEAIIALARSYRDPGAASLPALGNDANYYSASLILLAGIARREVAH